ncbi:MAG: DUF6502 family protein [Thiotrichales bacterium]
MNQALISAIYTILRPLVRILFRKGVAYGEISQVVKQVYVDVVRSELAATGQKATTSRIAVITGLTRKDVAQLLKAGGANAQSDRRANRVVRVIGGWLTDAEFRDANGDPAVLPLGEGPRGFEALVARYSGDMPYRAVLDELVRIGAVELTAARSVRLLTAAYLASDESDGFDVMGGDVALLISTIDHNLRADAPERRFQRKVSYDNLPSEAVAVFKRLAAAKSQSLLLELNEWLAHHDRDHNPNVTGSDRIKAGIGIYYFEEAQREKNPIEETHDED